MLRGDGGDADVAGVNAASQPGPSPAPPGGRRWPLALRLGADELLLMSDDVDTLIRGIDAHLDVLRKELALKPDHASAVRALMEAYTDLRVCLVSCGHPLTDPPLELDSGRRHALRQLLAELTGYRRYSLTPPLRALQLLLAAADHRNNVAG